MMKFSKQTLAVLKNFASINSNVLFQEGSTIKTISPQGTVWVQTKIAEEFPCEFGIYDLNQFLGVMSLFSDPEVAFTSKIASVKEGKTSIKYLSADRSVLKVPPEKTIKFESVFVEFDLTAAALSMALKTAGVLGSPDISIVGENGDLSLVVGDLKNSSANTYNVVLGETDKAFKFNLKVDNLKLIPQDYKIEISPKKISRWTAKEGDMTAFIAVESSSTMESSE